MDKDFVEGKNRQFIEIKKPPWNKAVSGEVFLVI